MSKIRYFLLCLLVSPGIAISADAEPRPSNGDSLYLHCFFPSWGQRVILDPSERKKAEPPTPPCALMTLNVVVGSDFDVSVWDGLGNRQWVKGRVHLETDRIQTSFKGCFGPSTHNFDGAVKLEEIFGPSKTTGYASFVAGFRCVLSKNKDIQHFLMVQKIADEERLKAAIESSRRNLGLPKTEEAEQAAPSNGDKPPN